MKTVFGRLYVHRNYASFLPPDGFKLYQRALRFCPKDFSWNIVNVSLSKKRVNFSCYSDFDKDEHPELLEYVLVDLKNQKIKRAKASLTNPPILHRKETFVEPGYPGYQKFKRLTIEEEKNSLYAKNLLNKIGFKKFWTRLLEEKGLIIKNHKVKKSSQKATMINLDDYLQPNLINTAKTAITRKKPSLPARIALKRKLIPGKVFDWGCGKGKDLEYFQKSGLVAEGWDPFYKPSPRPKDYPQGSFGFVHLAYILNVIPEKKKRKQVLKKIFFFLPKGGLLYVAVRSSREINRLKKPSWRPHGDGWLTGRSTFQKGFTAKELKKRLLEAGFGEVKVIAQHPVILLAKKPL